MRDNLYQGKHNICEYHGRIKDLAWSIEKIKETEYDNVKDLLDDVQSIASDIYSFADRALEAGQSMENRLKEYKDSIEGLGFTRNEN